MPMENIIVQFHSKNSLIIQKLQPLKQQEMFMNMILLKN